MCCPLSSLSTPEIVPFSPFSPCPQDSQSHLLSPAFLTSKTIYHISQIRKWEHIPLFLERSYLFLHIQVLTPKDEKNRTPHFWIFVLPKMTDFLFTPLKSLNCPPQRSWERGEQTPDLRARRNVFMFTFPVTLCVTLEKSWPLRRTVTSFQN